MVFSLLIMSDVIFFICVGKMHNDAIKYKYVSNCECITVLHFLFFFCARKYKASNKESLNLQHWK